MVLCVATLQNRWPDSNGNRGRDRMESMAGMKWNQWPGSNGMGGRNGVESLAGIIWNTQFQEKRVRTGGSLSINVQADIRAQEHEN